MRWACRSEKTSSLPALEHLLVRAENNVLYMTGGNTEIEITARAPPVAGNASAT